jgi:autotransporter-associated beta strand protein
MLGHHLFRRFALALLAGVAVVLQAPTLSHAQNTPNNYIGSTTGNVTTASNWSLGSVPTIVNDAVFPVGAATGIRNFGVGASPGPNLVVGSLNDLSTGTTVSIRNDTSSASAVSITLGGAGNLGNSVSGNSADLFFVTSGGTFNITGLNGSNTLGLILGQSGNFNVAGTSTISAAISGGFGLTKTGSGSLTLSGATANSYTGLTTVNAGTLFLGKTGGVNAIAGNLTIAGGNVRYSGTGAQNQLSNSANIVMTGGVFNGDGINANGAIVTETFGNLTVSGSGVVNAIGSSTAAGTNYTAGDVSFTGGSGATFLGGSGSILTVNSLSLTNMTATPGGVVATTNSFALFGNSTALRSTITVGGGGLFLDGSRLNLRQGGAGALGSRLILNGNVTTTGTAASAIFLDTAGGSTGPVAVELSSASGTATRTITTGSGGADLTIHVPITNGAATTGNVTKAGAGTLTLSALNTYNGTTTVNAGTLAYGITNALAVGGVTIDGASAELRLTTFSDTVGTVILDNGGSITSTTGVLTSTGSFDFRNGSASAILAGSGIALNKTTSGAVTLTGANTYTGGTSISGGSLFVNNTTGSGTGSGAVAVNATGTLGGNGTISGPTTVNVGGFIAPGNNSIDSLSISNSLTLLGTALFEIDDVADTNDVIDSITALNYGGTLTVTNLGDGSGYYDGQQFDLFDFATFTGTFSAINLPSLPGNFIWQEFGGSPFDYSNGLIQIQQVPEPATATLLACGGLALLLSHSLRRRRAGRAL